MVPNRSSCAADPLRLPWMNWLIVLGDAKPAAWVLKKQRMAFRAGTKYERISVGDRIALYTTRGAFHNPPRDQSQVFALGDVVSAPHRRHTRIEGVEYEATCDLQITQALPLREGVMFRPLV